MPDGVKRVTCYRCLRCEQDYESEAEANGCASRGFETKYEVGDVVVVNKLMGWFDGSDKWVYKTTPRTGGSGYWCIFYYVVTFISAHDRDGHVPCYHLVSLAMKHGRGHGRGWTSKYHLSIVKRIKGPKAAALKGVATRLGLVGRAAEGLL